MLRASSMFLAKQILLLQVVIACLLGSSADAAQLKLNDCRQSSTHTPCQRAIDGNTNQKWSGNSCAHTNLQNTPWWQANTPRLAHIKQVKIYNRLCGAGCSGNQNNIVVKVDGVPCAAYKSNTFFSIKTFNCDRVGQVVEIQSRKKSYLMLCEVQVFGSYVPDTHKGSLLPLTDCRQSSTHRACNRAIDNNLSQHFPSKSCAHTNMQMNPWWQANTKKLAHIKQVRIYARLCGPVCSRYLNNVKVKVDGHVCGKYKSTGGYISTHTFECDRVGQVVEIEATGKTYLMLCEIQAFGKYASLRHKGDLLPLTRCSQSSTHSNRASCNRAIDHNLSQHFPSKSCSHTNMQQNPWWQASTKKAAYIQQVRIFARLCGPVCSRYLKNLVVKVDGHVCSRYNRPSGYLSTYTFKCNAYGKTVRIESHAKTYLMLCEVQAFGNYGRKRTTEVSTSTGETGSPGGETGTTGGETGSPGGETGTTGGETGTTGGETSAGDGSDTVCIGSITGASHNVGSSWTTKSSADGFCYHHKCTGREADTSSVLTECMDAAGNCVRPGPHGTEFACRDSGDSSDRCLCKREFGTTHVIFMSSERSVER